MAIPGKFTNAAADGSYTFGSLPMDATFYARITATGYVATYAGPSILEGNMYNIIYPMLTAAEMNTFGVTAGNGIYCLCGC